MNLFYNPNISEGSKEIIFNKEESRHIGKVLRKNEGDVLHLTDGKGFFYEAILESANPKQCIARILNSEKQSQLPYSLHLAVAPTKLNDRYEWFLEKVTEIGITEITPIICEHSERKFIKTDRYERIIQSAAKQSLKAYMPILHQAVSFKEFMELQHLETTKLIAHCEPSEKKNLKELVTDATSILILIGPEGDFSENEIEQAITNGFKPVSLGNSRLRTETAAIVACHSVYFMLNK
ncbi:16S rRNA (uracil(1498)-N(3))-methyltransferase [Ulvibacter antarcticus]|uniref:Ribosomal RNA small subunit methyltransferase E n=1 Tax=Ulvibacter antarcticus TaxID=442714 RepID=A0A3L9YU03_9FLAO|nr:16S rRNA (uracil(1498)-N(3))-methyltransferase [Ulvibacter antarcticus]RMA64231.1 16S rRNA (uracil1498-N3)-methyltransferase [Ulvibacter antarcticus]